MNNNDTSKCVEKQEPQTETKLVRLHFFILYGLCAVETESTMTTTYGWGVRHIQMFCMSISLLVLFIARNNLSIALLAMTNQNRINDTNITIFLWDKKSQGIIMSSFFWTYTLMQVPSSLLVLKFGAKSMFMVGLVVNGIVSLCAPTLAYWGGWPMMCLCRVLMGLTQATAFPGTHTLLAAWLPQHERTTYIGLVYGGSKIGIILSLPFSSLLAETNIGWKLIFYVSGILLLLAALVFGSLAASTPSEHWMISQEELKYIEGESYNTNKERTIKTPWMEIFRCKPFWAIAAAHVGFVVFFQMFLVETPTYMDKILNIPLKNSGFYSCLPFIGQWFGSIFASMLFGKLVYYGYLPLGIQRKIANSIAIFGAAFGLIALCFVGPENKTLALFIFIASLTVSGFFVAGFMSNHLDLSPNFSGILLSLTNTFSTFVSVLIPIFTSLILQKDPTDLYSWRIIFVTTAVISSCFNVVYLTIGSVERQPWDDSDFKIKYLPEELEPALAKEIRKDN